jgi:hypothetical protein
MAHIVGKKFGRSTVVGVADVRVTSSGKRRYTYKLRCDCGHFYNLAYKSLGNAKEPCAVCRMAVVTPQDPSSPYRHPLYRAWEQMHNRCYNTADANYHSYGGRGIYVCARWTGDPLPGCHKSVAGFRQFLADMGEKPSPQHTLDRIDNNGPYSPENCRWATRKEQGANRSTTVWVEFGGERKPFCVWVRDLGVDKGGAFKLIRERGMTHLQVVEYLFAKRDA